MNPKGISAWKGGAENCIWRKQGVWNVDPITKRPVLRRPDFFRRRPNGSEINFMNDYMVPFFQKFATAIRKEIPNAIIFAEPHINIALAWKEEVQPKMPTAERYAWAPHYYDLLTLLSKSFRQWIVVDPLVRCICILYFFFESWRWRASLLLLLLLLLLLENVDFVLTFHLFLFHFSFSALFCRPRA